VGSNQLKGCTRGDAPQDALSSAQTWIILAENSEPFVCGMQEQKGSTDSRKQSVVGKDAGNNRGTGAAPQGKEQVAGAERGGSTLGVPLASKKEGGAGGKRASGGALKGELNAEGGKRGPGAPQSKGDEGGAQAPREEGDRSVHHQRNGARSSAHTRLCGSRTSPTRSPRARGAQGGTPERRRAVLTLPCVLRRCGGRAPPWFQGGAHTVSSAIAIARRGRRRVRLVRGEGRGVST